MTETVKEINRARTATAPFPSPDLGGGDNAVASIALKNMYSELCRNQQKPRFQNLGVLTMGLAKFLSIDIMLASASEPDSSDK